MYQFKVQAAYKEIHPEDPDLFRFQWIDQWVEADNSLDAVAVVVMEAPTGVEWSFPISVVDRAYQMGHFSAEQAQVHADYMVGLRQLD